MAETSVDATIKVESNENATMVDIPPMKKMRKRRMDKRGRLALKEEENPDVKPPNNKQNNQPVKKDRDRKAPNKRMDGKPKRRGRIQKQDRERIKLGKLQRQKEQLKNENDKLKLANLHMEKRQVEVEIENLKLDKMKLIEEAESLEEEWGGEKMDFIVTSMDEERRFYQLGM